MKNPKLHIAYFWNNDEKDCDVFIGDEEGDIYSQFKKYCKKSWDKNIKEDDIEGIYPVKEAEDCKMNVYKISVVNEITLSECAKEVQNQIREYRKRGNYNFLGFVETRRLPSNFKSLFSVSSFFNWVGGSPHFKTQMIVWRDEGRTITRKEIINFIKN